MKYRLDTDIYLSYLESMKDNFCENNDIEDSEIKNIDYDPSDLAWWYISEAPILCSNMSSSVVEIWANRLTTEFKKDEYKSLLLAIKEEISPSQK